MGHDSPQSLAAAPPLRSVYCGKCGYDLRGGLGERCPECGGRLESVGVLAEPRKFQAITAQLFFFTVLYFTIGLSAFAALKSQLPRSYSEQVDGVLIRRTGEGPMFIGSISQTASMILWPSTIADDLERHWTITVAAVDPAMFACPSCGQVHGFDMNLVINRMDAIEQAADPTKTETVTMDDAETFDASTYAPLATAWPELETSAAVREIGQALHHAAATSKHTGWIGPTRSGAGSWRSTSYYDDSELPADQWRVDLTGATTSYDHILTLHIALAVLLALPYVIIVYRYERGLGMHWLGDRPKRISLTEFNARGQ